MIPPIIPLTSGTPRYLQKSHVKSPNSHLKSAKQAFRTRLPPKVTRQVSKTSVSFETSSKTHMSKSAKLNERFARGFLQKSSGKLHRSTHIKQPCQAVSRFQPLQTTPAHTPIPMSQRHSPPPQLTTSRFHAPATKLSASTRLTRTKYCACREICHLRHTSQLHDSLRLPSSEHTPIHQNRHLS